MKKKTKKNWIRLKEDAPRCNCDRSMLAMIFAVVCLAGWVWVFFFMNVYCDFVGWSVGGWLVGWYQNDELRWTAAGWLARRTCSAASTALGRCWLINVNWRVSHALSARHGLHSILYFSCHGHKCLLDVGSILGACLEKWNAQMVGKFLIRIIKKLN